MKTKKIFLAVVIILLITNQSFATKWRINSNTDINADFSSLQTAINSSTVNAGDTLYCEGGSYFGDVSVDKHVVIIGPGFFLSQNDSTQAYTSASSVQNLTFKPGSDNSKIMGMKVLGILFIGNNNVTDTVSNITIIRNHINQIKDNGSTYSGNSSKFYNIKIINNYIVSTVNFNNYTKTLFLKNNIILYSVSLSPVTADVINNVIIYNNHYDALNAQNCNINNNIILNPGTGDALVSSTYDLSYNNNLSNNIISDAANTNNPSNYYNATLTAVFENSGSPDAKYQLKTGSPAIGYGTNGDDCGAFGGSQPYVLSGQPFLVPHIYEATIPGSVNKSNGLNITIKAKAQNH